VCPCEEVSFREVLVQEFCTDFVDGPENVGIPVPLILANVVLLPIVMALHHDGKEALEAQG